jgi:hypothetical protein
LDSTQKKIKSETLNLIGIYLILNKITLDYYIGSASFYSYFLLPEASSKGCILISLALTCGLAFAKELLFLRKSWLTPAKAIAVAQERSSTSTREKVVFLVLLPEAALLLPRRSAAEQRLCFLIFSLALTCALAFAKELLLLRKSWLTPAKAKAKEKRLFLVLLPEAALLLPRKSAAEQGLYSYFFVFLFFSLALSYRCALAQQQERAKVILILRQK